jgi:hypothetical protein
MGFHGWAGTRLAAHAYGNCMVVLRLRCRRIAAERVFMRPGGKNPRCQRPSVDRFGRDYGSACLFPWAGDSGEFAIGQDSACWPTDDDAISAVGSWGVRRFPALRHMEAVAGPPKSAISGRMGRDSGRRAGGRLCQSCLVSGSAILTLQISVKGSF